MAALGGLLAAVGIIASLVIWIMGLIKAFKAGETLWGVLGIFFPIVLLIWLFIRGQAKLGILWIVAAVVAGIGYGMFLPSMMSSLEQNMETLQQQTQ
ncbi:MAG: hypothetical protein MI807_12560 [Verrucomicrobiales bacterium]|nr:hypothetical protein [Verrucomicrobiales bacterium]